MTYVCAICIPYDYMHDHDAAYANLPSALLWTGKGQFICGNKVCENKDELKSWEVNFAYKEADEKKNALIKLRKCLEIFKGLQAESLSWGLLNLRA